VKRQQSITPQSYITNNPSHAHFAPPLVVSTKKILILFWLLARLGATMPIEFIDLAKKALKGEAEL